MSLILIVSGFGLAALPGMMRWLGRSLHPSTWTRMCIAALIGGAALTEIGLLLYAAPTALRAAGGTHLADVCQRTLDVLVPGGPFAGWLALGAAVLVASGIIVGLDKAHRATRQVRVEPSLGVHEPLGNHAFVVLPTDVAFAVSVAGRPGQIVVSQGLVDVLSDAELTVVLRHERAHLDLGHQTVLTAASAVEHGFWFLPPVQRSAQALRCAVERWADEVATDRVPENRDLLRWALVKVAGSLMGTTIAAFSGADTVAERLLALESSPRRPSAFSMGVLITPGVLLGGAGTAGLTVCLASVWTMVVMAGHCPL